MNSTLSRALSVLLLAACAQPPSPGASGGETRDDPMTTTTHELVIAGARVRWLETGPAGAPVVVLLHGARFRGSTWLEIDTPALLARAGRRVLAPDLPGFGDSEASPLPREEFLASWLDALEIERCVVVAPSMSGSFALPFAARHPERVEALIALAPVGIERWAPDLAAGLPALLLWGSEDHVVPVAQAALLRERLKAAELEVLPGAGHPAYLEEPRLFHDALMRFLDS